MATISGRATDKNRFKKIYPFVRRRPVTSLSGSVDMIFENGTITMTAASTGTYTFTSTFPSAPVISAVTADSTIVNSANVNVFVTSVSTTAVTFRTSDVMTGTIHFLASYIPA